MLCGGSCPDGGGCGGGGGSGGDSLSNAGSCKRLGSPKRCVKKTRPLTTPFSTFINNLIFNCFNFFLQKIVLI